MRSPSLTRTSGSRDGRFCSFYEFDGREVAVCDSARNALLVDEMLADPGLDEGQRLWLLPRMLFPDPDEAAAAAPGREWELVASVMWDAFGADVDGSHASEREGRVFDWREDAARIKATLRSMGVDWDRDAGSMSYADLCGLLASALEGPDNPFKTAVFYRTAKPPKRTRHNGDACDAFDALRRHYALKGPQTGAEADAADQDRGMASEFAAAKRAAEVGRG